MSLKARPSSGLSTTSYTSHLSSKTDLGLATEEDKPVFVLADYKPLPWPNRDSQTTLLEVEISSEIMNLEPAVAKPSEVQEFLAVDHDQSFKKSLHKDVSEVVEEVEEKTSNLQTSVVQLKSEMQEVKEKMNSIEKLMRELVKHHQISIDQAEPLGSSGKK